MPVGLLRRAREFGADVVHARVRVMVPAAAAAASWAQGAAAKAARSGSTASAEPSHQANENCIGACIGGVVASLAGAHCRAMRALALKLKAAQGLA